MQFFRKFKGNPPHTGSPFADIWTDALIADLQHILDGILFWETHRDPAIDRRLPLTLDMDRLGELTEAWIPVQTAYGPGVLIFDNSD